MQFYLKINKNDYWWKRKKKTLILGLVIVCASVVYTLQFFPIHINSMGAKMQCASFSEWKNTCTSFPNETEYNENHNNLLFWAFIVHTFFCSLWLCNYHSLLKCVKHNLQSTNKHVFLFHSFKLDELSSFYHIYQLFQRHEN